MVRNNEPSRSGRRHYTPNDILEDDFYKIINKTKNAVHLHNTV
ncbi:MAG: hypothetical protein PHI22_01410 [Bacilli bacterium]|nr:hypothetical protein [Bacilli bacterium]MDD4644262.1 hypothetical protein [Bacilli bacterium]